MPGFYTTVVEVPLYSFLGNSINVNETMNVGVSASADCFDALQNSLSNQAVEDPLDTFSKNNTGASPFKLEPQVPWYAQNTFFTTNSPNTLINYFADLKVKKTIVSRTPFESATKQNGEFTFKYDKAEIDRLKNKYNKALSHVGNKDAFLNRVCEIAKKYNASMEGMLVMFYSEGGINPKSRGGIFGAVSSIIPKYGISLENLRKLPAIKQLDYYEKMLKDQVEMAYGSMNKIPKKIPTAVLYAMNVVPAYVKDAIKDPKHILVAADSVDQKKRYFFNKNKGEGTIADGKNYISFDTITARLRPKSEEASSL